MTIIFTIVACAAVYGGTVLFVTRWVDGRGRCRRAMHVDYHYYRRQVHGRCRASDRDWADPRGPAYCNKKTIGLGTTFGLPVPSFSLFGPTCYEHASVVHERQGFRFHVWRTKGRSALALR